MTKLTISIILLLVIIQIKANRLLQQVPCTEEAKQCPDGSFVARTGPNCEFAQCPPCQVVNCLMHPCPCIPCPIDCAEPPICTVIETLITPEGKCCPTCQLDCSKVICLRPVCQPGHELVVPEGQCCPVCNPICPDTETMEFVECAGCPATCDNPDPLCDLMCQAGCRCKTDTPIWSEADSKCITAAECGPDCSTVRCARPVCQENEVEVIPDGACCAICEASGDKVECSNIADCEVDYKCKRDPKCRHLTGYEKLLCVSESATKKVCWRKQKNAFCPIGDCDEGYECVGIRNGNGICVDYQ